MKLPDNGGKVPFFLAIGSNWLESQGELAALTINQGSDSPLADP